MMIIYNLVLLGTLKNLTYTSQIFTKLFFIHDTYIIVEWKYNKLTTACKYLL